jgi:hypothetical protein
MKQHLGDGNMIVQIAYNEDAYQTLCKYDEREYTITEDYWEDSDEWFIAEIHSDGLRNAIREKHPDTIVEL